MDQEDSRPLLALRHQRLVIPMGLERPTLHLTVLLGTLKPELLARIQLLVLEFLSSEVSYDLEFVDLVIMLSGERGDEDVVGTSQAVLAEQQLVIRKGLEAVRAVLVGEPFGLRELDVFLRCREEVFGKGNGEDLDMSAVRGRNEQRVAVIRELQGVNAQLASRSDQGYKFLPPELVGPSDPSPL